MSPKEIYYLVCGGDALWYVHKKVVFIGRKNQNFFWRVFNLGKRERFLKMGIKKEWRHFIGNMKRIKTPESLWVLCYPGSQAPLANVGNVKQLLTWV